MNKKLVFVNEVPSKFIALKEYVKKVIQNFFVALDFVCEVKVEFINFFNVNEYETTDCALKNVSIKKHKLIITNSVLNSINIDGGKFFCSAIFHEFEHIRDYVKMMKTKFFKFNLGKSHQKNFERQYISTGFNFWTEVYAYYNTLNFSRQNNFSYEKITFCNLVKIYLKTISKNKSLYSKKDLSFDEANNYIHSVDSFIYLCAKYMGSVYINHSRVPYSRIDKNKDYKKVNSILSGLEPKVKRLLNDAYGPNSYYNLYKLGKYICENIRWKFFKVGLIKKNGKICSFY